MDTSTSTNPQKQQQLQALAAAEAAGQTLFAKRRPGWAPDTLDADSLQLDSFEPLEACGRQPCPKCGRSRSLFCCECLVAFTPTPAIKLPFQVHILSAEQPGKSTATHAAVLCSDQVQLHKLQELPQLDRSSSVVMFPSDDALTPDQLDLAQMQHVVIIDAKWQKARDLNLHESLKGMPRVKLPGTPRSKFWRFHTQGVSDGSVCTIEALHLLMQALAPRLPQPATSWDNLLWYFVHQHQLIAKVKAAQPPRQQQQQDQQHNEQQQQQKGAVSPTPEEQPAHQAKRRKLGAAAKGAGEALEAGGTAGEADRSTS